MVRLVVVVTLPVMSLTTSFFATDLQMSPAAGLSSFARAR